MTIETTANRISYTGSGTTGPFSFPYYFLADGDLTVIKTTIADGTEETLTLTTDYTISGAGEAAGGSVTLVATLSSAYKLTIIRDPDILQPADYPANDRFPAATHEKALDRATMILQRLMDLIDRSFRLSDGDVSGISLILSNLVAGELIAVNSAGTGIESIAPADVDLTTVSAFIQTLFNDADAATARNTLGAAALGANTFTGIQRWAKGSDVASANALTLGTDGNYFDITGTTAITSIGTLGVGTVVKLHFDGALTLTHHATDLILPGSANITTAAGDEIELVEYATGDWRMVGGVKADGTAWVDRKVVQYVESSPYATYASTATTFGNDDTIPQNTEGAEIMSVTITPKNSSNRLVIEALFPMLTSGGANHAVAAIFQDSTADALVAAVQCIPASNYLVNLAMRHEMAAGTTSSTTFKLRIGSLSSGTIYLNGTTSARLLGGVARVTLRVTEYKV